MIQPSVAILSLIENYYKDRSDLKIRAIYHILKHIYQDANHQFEKWWIGERRVMSSKPLRDVLKNGLRVKFGEMEIVEHLMFIDDEDDEVLYTFCERMDDGFVVETVDYVSSFHPR